MPASSENSISILVVGWGRSACEQLWDRIAAKSVNSFSYLAHPKYTRDDWSVSGTPERSHFFFESKQHAMPAPDHKLLASLERPGVPTINNMIMGDRVVSKLDYADGLAYATFLARRLVDLYEEIRPTVIVGGFDALHSGIALATARQMGIPWYALNFSVIPSGMACFCDEMHPASRVLLNSRDTLDRTALAARTLRDFEDKQIVAPAHIAPTPSGLRMKIRKLPRRMSAAYRLFRRSGQREFYRFFEYQSGHDVLAAMSVYRRAAAARKALSKVETIDHPPETPYAFFGLHMQPESSIDVWAPFYSNQLSVIELISRSLPPTHQLLVKIHKSDVSNYSRDQLERIKLLPGIKLVAPKSDARGFIENADLVIAIQGTIGLEAALIGKPVIMLGDSPATFFPSVTRIGKIHELPALIKSKLREAAPDRSDIINAYASYLAPFRSASHNNWTTVPSDKEIGDFVVLFDELRRHVSNRA